MFQNFQETGKDTWYHKTFEECRKIRKIKIHMWYCSITYTFSGLEHEKIYKLQGAQHNEMLSLYYTALGFISKNEEYNAE